MYKQSFYRKINEITRGKMTLLGIGPAWETAQDRQAMCDSTHSENCCHKITTTNVFWT